MPSKMEFEIGFSRSGERSQRASASPMRILYLGDYASAGSQPDLAQRRTRSLDIDTFDDLFDRIRPALDQFGLTFESMDDFHPDNLLKTAWFQELTELYQRLQNPTTFATAAAELRAQLSNPQPNADESPTQDAAVPAAKDDTFERLLGGETKPVSHRADEPVRGKADVLLREAMAPYIEASADPEQAPLLTAVEELLASRLCTLLHDEDFMNLESAWRGLDETVRRLEADEHLQLSVMALSRVELERDRLVTSTDLSQSQLYNTLVVQAADAVGGDPWSYIVLDLKFTQADADLQLLAYIGAVASSAGAQLITGADANLVSAAGLGDLNYPERWSTDDATELESWQSLRQSSNAQHIVLALPGVLLRHPYGAWLNPVDAFDFDEHDSAPTRTCLWGNGAYACAIGVANAFLEHGWNFQSGQRMPMDDLPTWSYEEDGDKVAQPTTQSVIGERAAEQLIARGLTPICHVAGTNEAVTMGLHSIAAKSA